jgi:hypothetical protein
VSLLTGRNDPLLAQWQYGLGRAVAWTSDARQKWATRWIGTNAFGTLTSQLVAWTLPPQDEQGIDVQFSPGRDGDLNVKVTSLDDNGAPRNFYRTVLRLVAPNLEPLQSVLTQVGPGRYEGTVRADQQGAYLVRVAQTRDGAPSANRTLGVVSPAAEEFRRLGVDADSLARYARDGQGRQIQLDPANDQLVRQVWTHDIHAAAFPTPIWPWLLLLAMVLVPIDVGVRRVALTRGDFVRARGWVARRVGLARPAPEVVPGLAELRAAKGRSVRRSDRAARPTAEPGQTVTPAASAPAAPRQAATQPARSSGARQRPPAVERPGEAPDATDPTETLAERLARRRRGG